MDPYCGWNLNTEQCTTAPEGMPSIYYWQQDMSLCPQVQHPGKYCHGNMGFTSSVQLLVSSV